MTEPTVFLTWTALWTIGFLVALRAIPVQSAAHLGSGAAVVCIVLGVAGLAAVSASTWLGADAAPVTRPLRAWLTACAPAVAGLGWSVVLSGRAGHAPPGGAVRQATARALAWYVGLAFLGFEVGKAAHDTEMREFFLVSGLPLALMYTVMLAESLAALALLCGWRRTAAAGLLGVIMLGAIGTHLHNGDAAADSADAVRMLVLCGALLALGRAPARTTLRPARA
ncbi:hypothetical protein E4L96_19575 [Massilia arenosa]|uniref:DoxX family protein n=1 Tax=Zemynaea arenosa TaxID=2561931 RepID=A0A4Y9RX57_9BURK|nr:DoxX family protein [Massilia arenosa]TFW13654.1 hypothetical protein E4L96_19575 [Massilia arenosa]